MSRTVTVLAELQDVDVSTVFGQPTDIYGELVAECDCSYNRGDRSVGLAGGWYVTDIRPLRIEHLQLNDDEQPVVTPEKLAALLTYLADDLSDRIAEEAMETAALAEEAACDAAMERRMEDRRERAAGIY